MGTRQHSRGRAGRTLDLQSDKGHNFKSSPDRPLDLFSVVASLDPRLGNTLVNSQLGYLRPVGPLSVLCFI